MKRHLSVMSTVVILILGSIVCFAFVFFLVIIFWVGEQLQSSPRVPSFAFAVPIAYFLGLGFWTAITAAGIWNRKSWARISLLVLAGALALLQTMSLGILWLAFDLVARNPSQDIPATFRFAFFGVVALPLAVAIWWLAYFARQGTKKHFLPGDGAETSNPKPLSIVVIAWHLVAGATITVYAAWAQIPAAFLGWLLTGWSATVVYLVWAAAAFYVGIGLLKWKPQFHAYALQYMWFSVANFAAFLALPGAHQRLIASWESIPASEREAGVIEPLGPFVWFLYAACIGTFFMALWYLDTRRKQYLEACKRAAHFQS